MIGVAEVDPAEHVRSIGEWVRAESPSDDAAAVNRLLDRVEAGLAAARVPLERVPGRSGLGDHLVARRPGSREGSGILLLAHLDTVWPVGTLTRLPFRIEGDRAFGPGIYDMKAGAYLGFQALCHLSARGVETPLPVTAIFNSDEEVGSPTSRALIEAEARVARYVLVLEPGIGPQGAVVTARKGWGRFALRVQGRAAHAGADHRAGRSAVVELAEQVLALEAMTDYERGTTVNVGVVRGGTRLNVVPAAAEAEIDLRVASLEEADRMVSAILDRRPIRPDVRVEVEGGLNRPPFERTDGVRALYEKAKATASRLGFDLPETTRGGVSDGNFTAALGVATLDGLGCAGHGAHAEDEHILVSSIAPRLALLIGMLSTLS